ncbi:aminoglycoside N6'-acetyltransferase [Alcanivorax hongdengensis A-11-3]|uniref:Aminoglycoside N6'-acetyltransferase n=1 Tax=Alcanivorax hongdengensis A-11-3 TaxID=1177179 RepID=L0W9T7_9GAMM|nr:GNAT family N-acetyltransferase [Alcanivorax hongdengensis]EKF73508.1 aminoglycoside N6'-acetyltransferase [Alcanivorax hongdengensis A-11-3]
MTLVAESGSLGFAPLTEEDLPALHRWLAQPHVVQWWGPPRSLEETLRDYNPASRCAGGPAYFLIELDGQAMGFIQRYAPVEHHHEGWWQQIQDPGVRGVDVFLARPEWLGRGLGTRVLRSFSALLFRDPAVTAVIADPAPDNLCAVRCFIRAGFLGRRIVVTPDGPALLMELTRSNWGD